MSSADAATSEASSPRLSRLTAYAPPPFGYAKHVWRYEATTMASSATTAAPSQGVRSSSARPPSPSTSTICSVAYATDDSGSEQNTGSARRLGRSVSPSLSVRSGLPTSERTSAMPHWIALLARPEPDLDAFHTAPAGFL